MLLAIQFLTIIPLKVKGTCSDEELAHSTSFFPLAGALQGILIALAAFAAIKIFSVEITSTLVVLILLLSNGGFDLDGLIDTFDALAVKSTGNEGQDRAKRLSVMKESSIGAIGAVALAITLLLKFVFLNQLFRTFTPEAALLFLFLMPVFSKWVTVIAMFHGHPAREEGLGRIFIGRVRYKQLIFSSLLVFVLYMSVAGLYLYPVYDTWGIMLFAALLLVLYLLALVTVRFTMRKFGGLTGDHLGALSEIAEILFLAVVPVWLQHST